MQTDNALSGMVGKYRPAFPELSGGQAHFYLKEMIVEVGAARQIERSQSLPGMGKMAFRVIMSCPACLLTLQLRQDRLEAKTGAAGYAV